MKFTGFLLVCLLVAGLAKSSFAYEDPNGLMIQVDRLVAGMLFSSAFRSGDEFLLRRKSCTVVGACSETNARYKVLSGDTQTAQVATYVSTRPEPSRLAKVTNQQWREISANMARNVVREIESYGVKVTLTSLRQTQVSVMVNGSLRTEPALELSFTGKAQFGSDSKQQLTLAAGFRGPGQIVRRVMDDGFGGHTTTELVGCKFNE